MAFRPLPKKQARAGRPSGTFTQHRRLDRLRDVLTANPAGLTLENLASLLHVTTRSVRRYLDELDHATEVESLETTPGGAHIWRIKPSERGRAVALRRAQAYGLLATRHVLEVFKGSALYDELDLVLRQVLQVAQRPTRTPGEVSGGLRLDERFLYLPALAKSHAARAEEIDVLFQAVAELRVLRFKHKDGGKTERVTAHPYALLVHRGAIVCVGLDAADDRVRVFPFDRMADLRANDAERFALPDAFDVASCVHGDFGVAPPSARAQRVIVEFDARVADDVRARRVHPSQKIATAPDGRVRVSMAVPMLEAVRASVSQWVLGFGAAARVIEPEELAVAVAAELERAAARYR
jgi:predicted DNA-binding transcriptional regulator YafY